MSRFTMLITGIGWLGVMLCTLGYFLLSAKKLKAEHLAFQLLNITGGLCLALTASFTNDIPNVVANLLWMSIGFYASVRSLRAYKSTRGG